MAPQSKGDWLQLANSCTNCCHLLTKLLGEGLVAHSSLLQVYALVPDILGQLFGLGHGGEFGIRLIDCICGQVVFHTGNQIKSNQITFLSHHHSTSALVREILTSVLQTVQKNKTISIWTVHIYRLYKRQCAKYTYIYSVHTVYYKDILSYQYTL